MAVGKGGTSRDTELREHTELRVDPGVQNFGPWGPFIFFELASTWKMAQGTLAAMCVSRLLAQGEYSSLATVRSWVQIPGSANFFI